MKKVNAPLIFKPEDFKVIDGEDTKFLGNDIMYAFHTKVGKDVHIEANFFFIPGNVEMRGLIWKNREMIGNIHLQYPLANYRGNCSYKPPTAEKILDSLILSLSRGNYELDE